jgi:2-polyprenyl-3-methyl-5-hydroxy-6-metoxy-1,4-benzoquinol methylase
VPIGEEFAALVPELSADRRFSVRLFMRACYSAYYHAYGTPDLHTHTRWRAVKHLMAEESLPERAYVLEVGCADGIMTFQVARRYRQWMVCGLDADQRSIESARLVKARSGINNVDFHVHFAPHLEFVKAASCDGVLLLDVIEHVQEDRALLSEVFRVLKPGGFVILSVPTPNYPRVFGRHFHSSVGHVREGYWQRNLESLFRASGFEVDSSKPYTFPPSAFACSIFYRLLLGRRGLPVLFSPLLDLVCRLDCLWPVKAERFACSIALKASKPAGTEASLHSSSALPIRQDQLSNSV